MILLAGCFVVAFNVLFYAIGLNHGYAKGLDDAKDALDEVFKR